MLVKPTTNRAFFGLTIATALSLMQLVKIGRCFAEESSRITDFKQACELYYGAKQCAGALNFVAARRGSGGVDRLMALADPEEFSRNLGEIVELGEPYQPDSPDSVQATNN
jgi:hypothetical protein